MLFVSTFVSMVGVGIIAPFLSTYAARLGANGTQIGLIFGGFALARAVFTPLFGRWSDLRGRKTFILVGLVLFSLFSWLYSLVATVLALALVRFLHGISSTMVTPIAMAYVADEAPPQREGEHLGTFSIALFLGMATGPFLGGTVAGWYGEKAAFYVMGGLTAAVAVFVAAALPDRRPAERPEHRRLRESMREGQVQGIMLYRLGNSLIMATLLAFLPLLGAAHAVGAARMGTLLTAYMVASSLLQRPFGRLADRTSKLRLILMGNVVKIAAFAAIPLFTGMAGWMSCAVLMALGTGMGIPASTAITAMLGRERGMGGLIGLFNTAMSIGMGVGPLVAGVLADAVGTPWVFPALGGAVLLTTLGVAWLLRDFA